MKYLKHLFSQKISSKGFTLIEMMVSISVFVLVISLGVDTIVNLTGGSKRVRAQRQAIDSFAFVMDSIARDLRTGARFNCSAASCYTTGSDNIEFTDQDGDPVGIFLDSSSGTIQRNDNGVEYTLTDASVVTIDRMAFHVRDASDNTPNEFIQPMVTIRIAGSVRYQNEQIPVAVQTTVTQRALDIPGLYGV